MQPEPSAQPDDTRPPIIPPAAPTAGSSAPRSSLTRQVIALLLNVCLLLFLLDACFSLMDDSLVLFLHVHALSGIRGIVVLLAMLLGFLVYVLMGLTPAVPKRLFIPIAWFNPFILLASLPAWIYFYTRAEQLTWVISLMQALFGLLVLWRVQGGWKWRWPLVPQSLVQGRLFTWPNLVGFFLVNALIVLPAIAGYLLFCTARAVDHFSEGFVALRPVGFTVQVRKYVRDDGKSILLVPMSHIGEPEFYRSLAKSFPTNSTILMEGVTDDKNLLTNRITYKRIANTLGLAQQQREFRPSPEQIVPADIDVDQFAPSTIGFLNLVMLIHARGLTPETFLMMIHSSDSPEFEEQIFGDILRKRNQHLLQTIHENLPTSDRLVVPWGAAHMPEIAREIQKSGFHLETAREYVAIRFANRPPEAR